MDKLSNEALAVISRIVKELSSCKYAYKSTASGCFECCIGKYGLTKPIENKEIVVDSAIHILNNLNKEH